MSFETSFACAFVLRHSFLMGWGINPGLYNLIFEKKCL